jgi:16S rRNA (guanine966-N2)-methyltransferase
MTRGLHVVAGEAKGVPLVAPRGARPTAGRVREALFSALGHVVVGAVVLDLYAGSGALAIEALSRGAARAVLVDRDRAAADACGRNLDAARLADRGRIQRSTVAAVLRADPLPEAPFDLVLVDPPYQATVDDVTEVLVTMRAPGWLAPGARVVVERAARTEPLPAPAGWEVEWQREYGDTLVVILCEQD